MKRALLLIIAFFTLTAQTAIDGDTFQHGPHRIRVWGIDAPERNEAGYAASTQRLQTLITRNKPACKFLYRDRYNRPVARCEIGKKDLGHEMVASGYARDYTRYSKGQYLPAENKARLDGSGLWAKDWRK